MRHVEFSYRLFKINLAVIFKITHNYSLFKNNRIWDIQTIINEFNVSHLVGIHVSFFEIPQMKMLKVKLWIFITTLILLIEAWFLHQSICIFILIPIIYISGGLGAILKCLLRQFDQVVWTGRPKFIRMEINEQMLETSFSTSVIELLFID